MYWVQFSSVAQSCPTLLRPHGLYSPWNSPGRNTGVGSLSLLLGIFPTQGLNPGLPHCRAILYQLRHKGSPYYIGSHSVQFSCSVMSDSLPSHELQHARPPCPSPTPGVHPNPCPLMGDAIQPSYPLSSLSPPALNLSQHQGLFK